MRATALPIRLGLRENAAQFSLLVVINAFVGAMVGMERAILSPIAEEVFQLAAKTAVLRMSLDAADRKRMPFVGESAGSTGSTAG